MEKSPEALNRKWHGEISALQLDCTKQEVLIKERLKWRKEGNHETGSSANETKDG